MICVISDTCLHCWPSWNSIPLRPAHGLDRRRDHRSAAPCRRLYRRPHIREAMIIAGKVFKEMNEEEGSGLPSHPSTSSG